MLVGLVVCYRLCGLCSLTSSKLPCSVSHGGAGMNLRRGSRYRRGRRSNVAWINFRWCQFLLKLRVGSRFNFGKAAGLCAADPEGLQLATVNSSLQDAARKMRAVFLGPYSELPLQSSHRISYEVCMGTETTKCKYIYRRMLHIAYRRDVFYP